MLGEPLLVTHYMPACAFVSKVKDNNSDDNGANDRRDWALGRSAEESITTCVDNPSCFAFKSS
jgi:hypothetical protein